VAKVFLSYAREDVDTAKPLAECIGRAGHEVWWDRQIQGGSRFATEIDRELKDAEAVVVLWTKAALESAWVQDEAAEGRDTGRLVPASLDGCRPPLGFRQFHTVDLAKWNGGGEPENLQDLLGAIAKTTGETTASKAGPGTRKQETPRGTSIFVHKNLKLMGGTSQESGGGGITVES
jgi:adenylate cyclase